jgi:hypothetical protein
LGEKIKVETSECNPIKIPEHGAPPERGAMKALGMSTGFREESSGLQMIQTPRRALKDALGSDWGSGGKSPTRGDTSVTRQRGIRQAKKSCTKYNVGRATGTAGVVESGSCGMSEQHGAFSLPSQDLQHFVSPESREEDLVQPGATTRCSSKQTRIDAADAGTKKVMHSSKNAAVRRRITLNQ